MKRLREEQIDEEEKITNENKDPEENERLKRKLSQRKIAEKSFTIAQLYEYSFPKFIMLMAASLISMLGKGWMVYFLILYVFAYLFFEKIFKGKQLHLLRVSCSAIFVFFSVVVYNLQFLPWQYKDGKNLQLQKYGNLDMFIHLSWFYSGSKQFLIFR